jgi:hypothetical protein
LDGDVAFNYLAGLRIARRLTRDKDEAVGLDRLREGPTGFGARFVEISRNLVPDAAAGLGSELLATPGTTAATSPLAAPFLRNVLRFMLSSPAFL